MNHLDIPFDFAAAAALGASVGTSELLSRYRDAPGRAISTGAAGLYVLVNAVASMVALGLAHLFGWTFGVSATEPDKLRWVQVLTTGVGAMGLLRSSLLVARVGDQDVGIGPVAFLSILLQTTDREVDRIRATARATAVAGIMNGVTYDKAHMALPTYCLALMQNLSPKEQETFAAQLAALHNNQDMVDTVKVRSLGLAIMSVMGEPALRAAVTSLGDDIRGDPGTPDGPPAVGPSDAVATDGSSPTT